MYLLSHQVYKCHSYLESGYSILFSGLFSLEYPANLVVEKHGNFNYFVLNQDGWSNEPNLQNLDASDTFLFIPSDLFIYHHIYKDQKNINKRQ